MRAWDLIGSSRGFSLLNETELSFPCTYPDSSYSPSILLSRVFLGKWLKRGSRAEHTVYPCIHNVRLQSHLGMFYSILSEQIESGEAVCLLTTSAQHTGDVLMYLIWSLLSFSCVPIGLGPYRHPCYAACVPSRRVKAETNLT